MIIALVEAWLGRWPADWRRRPLLADPLLSLACRLLRNRFLAGAYRLIGLKNAPVARTPMDNGCWAVALMRYPREPGRGGRLRLDIAALAQEHACERLDDVPGFEAFAPEPVAEALRQQFNLDPGAKGA